MQARSKAWLIAMCLGLLASSTRAQSVVDIVWEDPIAVAPETYDNNRPRMALNASGQPVVMWGQNSGNQVHVAVFNGSAFDYVGNILPEGVEAFTADWAGPDLDANGGNVGVVFKRYPEDVYGAYLMQSIDGGQTWGDTVRIDPGLEVDFQSRFPTLAYDASGEAAVTLMTFEGNYLDPAYEVALGTENNTAFTPLTNTSTAFFEGEACDCCMADLVHSGDELIQLYRNNTFNVREVKAVRSTSNGAAWEESFNCDLSGTYSNVCFSSGPSSAMRDGMLYSAFRSNLEDGVRTQVSVNDLSTGEVVESVTLDQEVAWNVSQNNARLALNEQYVAVVWEEVRTTTTNVLMAFGAGTPALLAAHDTVNVEFSGRQVNPDIAMDGTYVHVVWQDKEFDQVMYRRGVLPAPVSVEPAEETSLMAAPNPCRDRLTLQVIPGTEVDQVWCFNVQGRRFQCPAVQHTKGLVVVDVSGLAPGLWLVNHPDQDRPVRVIKQ